MTRAAKRRARTRLDDDNFWLKTYRELEGATDVDRQLVWHEFREVHGQAWTQRRVDAGEFDPIDLDESSDVHWDVQEQKRRLRALGRSS